MNKVINFHDVHDAEWFEKIVLLLKKKYTMVSASQIVAFYYQHKELPKNSCLITVDDGAETSYTIIYPILKKYHVPAIFFVSPMVAKREVAQNFWFQEIRNCHIEEIKQEALESLSSQAGEGCGCKDTISRLPIDKIWDLIHQNKKKHGLSYLPPQNMTVDQIQEIDREGIVEIGAHTMWHPFLASESAERSDREIKTSISDLADMLGHEVLCFAYPNGRPVLDFGEREIQTLCETTCKVAFSTHPRNLTKKNNPYAIPRFGLSCGSMRFVKVKLWLGEFYLPIKQFLSRLKM